MSAQARKGGKRQESEKIYIIDTNVLIHDPDALLEFHNTRIGLPIPVIQELDHFKRESSAKGSNARQAIRMLDKLREHGSLAEGVKNEVGTIVQILLYPGDTKDIEMPGLPLVEMDNKILLTALAWKQQGLEVQVVSKDLNMRVKADAVGLVSHDYQKGEISKEHFYQGWIEYAVSAKDLSLKMPQKTLDQVAREHELMRNQFVRLISNNNPENYKVFRYLGQGVFRPAKIPKLLWPIEPHNPEQLMALDLLFDDSIQFVCLFGPAGTGKTFLTLLAGLHKMLIEKAYEKILIARPVVPLGRDIGYLPGDIQEKMYSWMQPVRDNMEFIMHKAYQGMKSKDKKKGNGVVSLPSLEDLIHSDKVNMEAITYMRGRSIPYQFIFIDEVQNLTPHEVKTLITRVGEGSKIILTGDPFQIDSPYLDFTSNGLVVASEKFKGQSLFGSVYLDVSERSRLSQLAAELL